MGGYYWLPCPLCGEMFGGHEKHGVLYYGVGGGETVCIDCADKAKDINRERGYLL